MFDIIFQGCRVGHGEYCWILRYILGIFGENYLNDSAGD